MAKRRGAFPLAKRPVVLHSQHLVRRQRRDLPRAWRQVDRGVDALPVERGVECRAEVESKLSVQRLNVEPAVQRDGVAADRLDPTCRLVGATEVNLIGDDLPTHEAKRPAVLKHLQAGGVGRVEDFVEHHVAGNAAAPAGVAVLGAPQEHIHRQPKEEDDWEDQPAHGDGLRGALGRDVNGDARLEVAGVAHQARVGRL